MQSSNVTIVPVTYLRSFFLWRQLSKGEGEKKKSVFVGMAKGGGGKGGKKKEQGTFSFLLEKQLDRNKS